MEHLAVERLCRTKPASCTSPRGFKAPQGELALEGGWRAYHVAGQLPHIGHKMSLAGGQESKDSVGLEGQSSVSVLLLLCRYT